MKSTGAPHEDTPGHRRSRDPEAAKPSLSTSLGRIWRSQRPGTVLARDLVVVALVIGVLLGGLWTYSGQSLDQPPLVVVESGSMMHPDAPFGRIGTIDPGDLVLVKEVDARDAPARIATAYEGAAQTAYGGYGDVIVFRPLGDLERTPIIHRALTWVEATPAGDDDEMRYEYRNLDGEMVTTMSVDLPEVGIVDMKPPASGFVTKGDNPQTNHNADPVSHMPGRLVQPEWILGTAKGQAPWLGLIKLAFAGNPVPFDAAGHCKVLRATAPCDTWAALGISAGVLLAVPFALEMLWKRSETVRGWTA